MFGCFCWLINVPKKKNLASVEGSYKLENSPGGEVSESVSFEEGNEGSITSPG